MCWRSMAEIRPLKFKVVTFDDFSKTAARLTAGNIYEGLVEDIGSAARQMVRFGAHTRQAMQDKRAEHEAHIAKYGNDQPDIRDWKWDGT